MIASIFLFALAGLAVPIAIAFWNRKRYKKEVFGGFFLLKRAVAVKKRRIQLLEILKLLNRLALITFVILIFAEPLTQKESFEEAENGFALILDVSRVMQGEASSGASLIDLQIEKARQILLKIPQSSRGALMFLSDRCELMRVSSTESVGSPQQWLDRLQVGQIPYANAMISASAFAQCLARLSSLYEGAPILKVLISPLPLSLGEASLNQSGLKIEALPAPEFFPIETLNVEQRAKAGGVELRFSSEPGEREMSLIQDHHSPVALGDLRPEASLPLSVKSWLWIRSLESRDPWQGSQILSLDREKTYRVTVWAQRESLGFDSLVAALRSHPQVEVIRQLGGEPMGDPVIIYGSYSQDLQGFQHVWLFSSLEGQNPFEIRDQKSWSQSAQSGDVRRSFEIAAEEGDIFVKRYNLFSLSNFEILESFKDGAPSLLSYQSADSKIWLTPFDLEDLTTDLTLEPSFIPYLYSHLRTWLGDETEDARDTQDFEPVWMMPGVVPASAASLREMRWPGVYRSGSSFRVVEPLEAPREFMKEVSNQELQATLVSREVSLRDFFLKAAVTSLFLELLICFISARLAMMLLFFGLSLSSGALQAQIFSVEEGTRNRQHIPIAYYPGMQNERRESLDQLIQIAPFRTNLDFEKPSASQINEFWKYSSIIFSLTGDFPKWSKSQHEQIRAYLEAGGLLIFDDPSAVTNSSFYRWFEKTMSEIFPGRAIETLARDDVLFRTFYLLNEVSGRRLSSPHLRGLKVDGRWVAIFSVNDLLGATYRLRNGDYGFSVSPYGPVQRILAERLLINFLMYSVTVDYKDDAIHLPHILKRRVR